MSKRARSHRQHSSPHPLLPRLDRPRRRRPRGAATAGAGGSVVAALAAQKRALKRATVRDCSHRCVYCGSRLELDAATLDHVYPLARGGSDVPGNLVSACAPCNRRKGDMLPHEFFHRFPTAGLNFLTYARVVHRALKRGARRAVSLAMAGEEMRRAA